MICLIENNGNVVYIYKLQRNQTLVFCLFLEKNTQCPTKLTVFDHIKFYVTNCFLLIFRKKYND